MDDHAKKLINIYQAAENDILRSINKALLKPDDLKYLRSILSQVQSTLGQLNKKAKAWTDEAVEQQYRDGFDQVDEELKQAGRLKADMTFSLFHQRAVQILAENTYSRLESVSQVIGRKMDDLYRNYALEGIKGTTFGYETYAQVAKRYREKLAEQGITGFVDRAGRAWNMATYTEMVAITTTAEAYWTGTENRLLEHGFDLVKVSTHAKSCERCAPWQGKVLSLTGRTEGYPTMEQAIAAGFRHPRCRHAFGAYLDLDEEIRKLEARGQ
jgi:hypothetical protein